ncbi:MAG: hypothetical protein J6I49_02585 [Bacteroidales bacterium]|nr:hypothetical protein [Bacteroidales bacterium]
MPARTTPRATACGPSSRGWQSVYRWTPGQRARLEKAIDTIFGHTSPTGNTSSTSILAQAVRDCDLYLDTEPHINGHFTRNFLDLRAGQKLRTVLIPADPRADLRNIQVKVRTLNDLYTRPSTPTHPPTPNP